MDRLLPAAGLRAVAAVLAVCLFASSAWAQFRVLPARGGMRGFIGPAVVAPQPAEGTESKSADDDSKFPDGPALKTDPEAQQLLSRADQFVNDERYDLAAVLWQKVLDDAGDNLVSVDGRLYISLRRQVEQRLANLPALALQTYRVTADGQAQAVLSAAGAEKEEEALSEVVRRFFLSSHGDDAAYKLGCLALDRHDFVGAARYFAKVLEEHPDPSVPVAEVLLRLAVASSRVGDKTNALKHLAEIEKVDGSKPSRTLVSQIAGDVANYSGSTQLVSARLAMPPVPPDATAKTLTELWSHEYPMVFQDQPVNRQMMYGFYGRMVTQEKRQISRDQVIDKWKQNGWMPAGKLLFADGRVYFKTNNNITAWSTAGEDKVLWKSAWNNEFDVDDYSQQLVMMAMNYGIMPGQQQDQRPKTPAEILLFGDAIHQDMSIIGNSLYNIEGRRTATLGPSDNAPRPPKPFNWNSVPRRTRVNWLASYDLRTGKARWHRSADDEAKDGSDGGMGFMAAPVACGNQLLVPVIDGGAMWLYGLSPEDGKTQWKTYLCDEPPGGCEPWSPISVAVEGRDAYVLSGAGVVFALDGTSGAIRWVVRYHRDEKVGGPAMRRNMYAGGGRLKDFNGFAEDRLIVTGRHLIVMATDSDWVDALDCRTGELLWKSPRSTMNGEMSYCVGVQGRGLYLAGKSAVRKIDIPSGKIAWVYPEDGKESQIESFGRAVLTQDGLYVPVDDSILKLDPEKGTELSHVGVSLTSGDPVGNLYSDGEKLWVLSANRFYSLTHLEYRMKALDQRVEQGDSAALLDRARLLARIEQWDRAMDDLASAYALISKQKDPEAAASAIFALIDELKLTAEQPQAVLRTLTDLFGGSITDLKPDHRVKVETLVSASLSSMPRTKTPNVAATVLAASPLLRQEYLVQLGARVLKSVAMAEDKQALKDAVISDKSPASLIAAEAWSMLDPEEARPILKSWLERDDEKLKLLTARALLQTGDVAALETLLRMMESADLQTRIRSYQSLRAATANTELPFTAYAAAEDRTKQLQAWKDWYASNKDSVKLVLPLPEAGTQLGRTLVASHGRNQVVELDATGKEIGRKTLPQPWSALGLPNGNRMVATTQQNRLVEYDDKWNEVWTVEGLPAGVWSMDRAPDGTTVVACADAAQIVEIRPGKDKEKKVLWRGDGTGRPVFVRRLENGNTLICLQTLNKVIEIDPAGKQVWEAGNLVNPFSAQRLENGNTLVAAMVHGANGMIVELDRTGRQVSVPKQGVRQLYAAERLQNGNLMYVDNTGLHEIDPDGKVVLTRRETNITGFSRF